MIKVKAFYVYLVNFHVYLYNAQVLEQLSGQTPVFSKGILFILFLFIYYYKE